MLFVFCSFIFCYSFECYGVCRLRDFRPKVYTDTSSGEKLAICGLRSAQKAKAAQNAPLSLLLFVKIETLVETINTSAGINELLLTCEERVAF